LPIVNSAIANPRPTELAGALKRGLGRGAQRRRDTPSKTIVSIPFSTPPSDRRSNGWSARRSSLPVYHHDAFIQLWTGEAEVISYLARAVLQQDRTPLNVTVKFSSSMPLPGSSVTMGLLRMNNSGSAP